MKLKIAYSISFFPALSETYLLNQLSTLIEHGHEVTIFSTGKPHSVTKHAILTEYNLLSKTVYRPQIPKNKLKRVLKAFFLLLKKWRYLKHTLHTFNFIKYGSYALKLEFFYDTIPFLGYDKFDVVHCHFGPNAIKALNFREIGLLQGYLVTSFHGYDVNHKEFLSRKKHFSREGLYKDLIQECKCFTVNSAFTKAKAVQLGIPETEIKLLPVGLDINKFKPEGNSDTSSSYPFILTVARLTEFKGLDYSIRAISNLIHHYPKLKYHIIGEGEQRSELEQLIEDLKLSDYVFLHGACTQEKIFDYYNKATIFVLSGVEAGNEEVEAQGLAVQEAQSMELPVVVTDAGGLKEGMISGKSGFVVRQRDVLELTEKINLLLKHPDERVKMGKAGRKFVVKHFDKQELYKQLESLYTDLIGRHKEHPIIPHSDHQSE